MKKQIKTEFESYSEKQKNIIREYQRKWMKLEDVIELSTNKSKYEKLNYEKTIHKQVKTSENKSILDSPEREIYAEKIRKDIEISWRHLKKEKEIFKKSKKVSSSRAVKKKIKAEFQTYVKNQYNKIRDLELKLEQFEKDKVAYELNVLVN